MYTANAFNNKNLSFKHFLNLGKKGRNKKTQDTIHILREKTHAYANKQVS